MKLKWWDRFFEFMGWHKAMSMRALNPASANGLETYCVRCGARLLMDSQGNWFAVSALEPRKEG